MKIQLVLSMPLLLLLKQDFILMSMHHLMVVLLEVDIVVVLNLVERATALVTPPSTIRDYPVFFRHFPHLLKGEMLEYRNQKFVPLQQHRLECCVVS